MSVGGAIAAGPVIGASGVGGASSGSSSGSGLGVLSSIVGLVSDLANLGFGISDRVLSQKNFNKSFDYQKALNERIMEREDTAYQRAVEDIRSAGLSPLALTSGSPVSALSGSSPQSISGALSSSNSSARLATLAGLRQQMALQKNSQAVEWYNAITQRINALENITNNNRNRPILQQNANSASETAKAATSQAESAKVLAGVQSDVRDINKHYAETTGLPYGVVGQESSGASVSAGPFKVSGHGTSQVSVVPPKSAEEFIQQYTGSEYQVRKRLDDVHASDGDFTRNSFIIQEIIDMAKTLYDEYTRETDPKSHVNFYEFKEKFYNHHNIPWFRGTHGEPTIDINNLNARYHSRY